MARGAEGDKGIREDAGGNKGIVYFGRFEVTFVITQPDCQSRITRMSGADWLCMDLVIRWKNHSLPAPPE